MQTRIDSKFHALSQEKRAGLITYMMAGDPDYRISLSVMKALPKAGADFIELGIPFSDPMADGPVIQAAGLRALKSGQTLKKTLDMVREFRQDDHDTPVILMGYYNPIYVYGVDTFLIDAKAAGIDALIVVDLPAEMDEELCIPAMKVGINFIRLATPTTDAKRLSTVLENASGFLYYVSMAGITGQSIKDLNSVCEAVSNIKQNTTLPIAVGFGIKTKEQVGRVAKFADGIVVGSAIVDAIAANIEHVATDKERIIDAVRAIVSTLSAGVRVVQD